MVSSTPPVSDIDLWVNKTFVEMTEDEKIGQLFMIRAHSDKDAKHIKSVKDQIKKYHVGGLCFFQGTPEKQSKLINEYQAMSDVPLLVSMDAEWGLGMRLKKTTISFPRQLMLGAIQDNNLIYDMGLEIADHLKTVGVNVSFSPVVDVNNNPDNPVINDRSFGEDKYNVAAKGVAYMKGLQAGNVMACAKHFPGHGDTDVDSHADLPIINHDRQRLDDIELFPFKALINHGVHSMMIAHLNVPSFDNRTNMPTTLSDKTVTGVLKNYLGFHGLIYTDALEMKGVAKHFAPGKMEVEALKAGNDILLLPIDIGAAVKEIKLALETGELRWEDINHKVLKILAAKYQLGLTVKPKKINVQTVTEQVNQNKSIALKSRLIENAITLAKDDNNILPIRNIEAKHASLSIGSNGYTEFQNTLEKYTQVDKFFIPKEYTPLQKTKILQALSKYETVFISVHDMSKYSSKSFGIPNKVLDLIYDLDIKHKVVLTLFGSPYALKYFSPIPTVVMAYNEDPMTQRSSAQAIFGAIPMKGKLPVTASPEFVAGQGLVTPDLLRLGYAIPESVGLDAEKLKKIDTIAAEMIKTKAAPGCQILVAKDGKIVHHKSYGYYTYDKKRKTTTDDIYDVASVTKIMATTISLMRLTDNGLIRPNSKVREYLAESDTTNKGDLVIEEILAHQSGLNGWIPFYKSTMSTSKNPKPLEKYYRTTPTDSFNIPVANNLYMWNEYVDSVYAQIYSNSITIGRGYKYSDLGFYLMRKIVERTSHQTLDQYAAQSFYKPLGLQKTLFNPLRVYSKDQIAPTEKDKYFRNQTIQGHVHDMGAAMLGGVSGHAGLFSTTADLAILGQMLLNGGSYGGQQYIQPETVKRFTTRYSNSLRRGLGFDMKQLDSKKKMNMSEEASPSTFGHLGFTGDCIWIDPENDIIYVLLSNRTYPSMSNNKFGKKEFRPRIQTAIYEAMIPDAPIATLP
jgi:beta-glucosidase-like glycosyl hydrolase/CubicO group peptidase (beta-lactamase class C family)